MANEIKNKEDALAHVLDIHDPESSEWTWEEGFLCGLNAGGVLTDDEMWEVSDKMKKETVLRGAIELLYALPKDEQEKFVEILKNVIKDLTEIPKNEADS